MKLHFTNVAKWHWHPYKTKDMEMHIAVEKNTGFRPFRGHSNNEDVMVWHRGAIQILVEVTSDIVRFQLQRMGISVVAYLSYLGSVVFIVRFFLLHGMLPGMRYLTRCICSCMWLGRNQELSTTLFRSILVKHTPDFLENPYEFVTVKCDVGVDEDLGIEIDTNGLAITSIRRSSVMDKWNRQNLDNMVMVGDFLIEVNGQDKQTPHIVKKELKRRERHFEMTILRANPPDPPVSDDDSEDSDLATDRLL
jgi:hypothetical protein